MSNQYGLGNHRTKPSGLCQPDHGDDQMEQKREEVAHLGNRTKTPKLLISRFNLEFANDRSRSERSGSEIKTEMIKRD